MVFLLSLILCFLSMQLNDQRSCFWDLSNGFLAFWWQLKIQGSSPGVRAGHAALSIGTKASSSTLHQLSPLPFISFFLLWWCLVTLQLGFYLICATIFNLTTISNVKFLEKLLVRGGFTCLSFYTSIWFLWLKIIVRSYIKFIDQTF